MLIIFIYINSVLQAILNIYSTYLYKFLSFSSYCCRYIFIAGAYAYQVGLKYSDRFYTPLPLYHTAAGIMCIGQSLLYGCTTVIRKKFSASGYFSDISKHNCTVSQFFIVYKYIMVYVICTSWVIRRVFPCQLLFFWLLCWNMIFENYYLPTTTMLIIHITFVGLLKLKTTKISVFWVLNTWDTKS